MLTFIDYVSIITKYLSWFFIKDIDECVESNDICTCANGKENPSCKSKCINKNGSYACECSDGYYLLEKGICIGKLLLLAAAMFNSEKIQEN